MQTCADAADIWVWKKLFNRLDARREDAESPREKVQVFGILLILQAVGVFQSRVISDKYRI